MKNILIFVTMLLPLSSLAVDWGAISSGFNKFQSQMYQQNQNRQPSSNQVRAIRDGNTVRYYTSNGILVKYSISRGNMIYTYSANGVLLGQTRLHP